MDSLIAKLRVALQLDSAAFETGAKRAAAEVNTLGTRAEKAGFAIGTMGKALVAGASAFAAIGVVQQLKDAVVASLDYASSLSETAQQLGVTVESLQQFRLLAEQNGIATETMDKALQKLTRSMGEAAAGGKKQSTAFDELGISLRDASGHMRTADQLLPEIAGALEKVASPAERARLEVALFGKTGQELEPLLGQGEAAIRRFMDQAAAAGIIISKELADKADTAKDKIDFLQKKLGMQFTVKVAEHAGDIEKIVDALSRLVDQFFALIKAMEAFANSPAGKFLGKLNGLAGAINPINIGAGAISGLGGTGGGGATKPPPSAPMNLKGVTFGGPLKAGGSFKGGVGPLANFAGGGILGGGAANDLAGMAPGLLDHGNYVRSVVDSMEELSDKAEETAQKSEVATVKIAKSFGEMARDAIGSLQNLIGAIRSGDVGGILSSILNIGLSIGQAGGFGAKAASFLADVPAFAGGTSFAPGGMALVGERGPELVNLPRGSQVYPSGTGPSGRGGNVYHISGNLLTPEFWAQIQQGNLAAAQAGGEIGYRRVNRSASRSVWDR
jgi:hypothetical protein